MRMVLITRYLPSVNENNLPSLDNVTSKDAIVDTVMQNSTVGIINQLMVLAGHANSIFASLTQESAAITQRLNNLNQRMTPLIQMIPTVESYHQRSSIDVLNSHPRAEYHADNPEKHQMFLSTMVPPTVKEVYQGCQAPPKLHLLDPYMDNNQKSLKLYTNPDFFIDEWVAEQTKLREEARQRRRERKEARLKKKTEKTAETSEVKVKRVHKVRYDPVTGEKILIPFDSPAAPSSAPTAGSAHVSNLSMQPAAHGNHLPPPPSNYPAPPPAVHNSGGSAGGGFNAMPPPPPPQDHHYHPTASGHGGLPPPPLSQSSSAYFQTPPPPSAQNHYATPPPTGMGAGSRQSVIQSNAAPPPPPPPAPAPPPPPPPMSAKNPLASALEGANLKATEIKPKAQDARSDLLSSIIAGRSLKPMEERAVPEPVASKDSGAINVADILARRIAWAPSDSEDDDSDDDSDWD
ncbi:SCAR1 [Cavenderia fasciculata]|uniref:SCAR1 n=1 Tax=Cavenderia fasciculata TaxID=261658 RepID=F4Q699_CACFS|nr:SCAR1 [Cavenderia fasciculata]EGG17473.1 SCAR1 [Cavenderia fasciculata]|eukprot:XP_004355957.1 SCAR1 [Cavenderia fasciculata]